MKAHRPPEAHLLSSARPNASSTASHHTYVREQEDEGHLKYFRRIRRATFWPGPNDSPFIPPLLTPWPPTFSELQHLGGAAGHIPDLNSPVMEPPAPAWLTGYPEFTSPSPYVPSLSVGDANVWASSALAEAPAGVSPPLHPGGADPLPGTTPAGWSYWDPPSVDLPFPPAPNPYPAKFLPSLWDESPGITAAPPLTGFTENTFGEENSLGLH